MNTLLQRTEPLGPAIPPRAAFSLGRSFLGAATLASGVLQLVVGDFVRLVPKLPGSAPVRSLSAHLVGVVLVAIGAAILLGRMVKVAAALLGVLLLVLDFFLYLPSIGANPQIDRPWLRGFMYTNPLKSLALFGGAALLVDWRNPRLQTIGALLLAVFLIVCGMQHFAYRDFVTAMVPSWMPGRRFWTYFTGVALMAGGVGILIPATARLAASSSAVMIFLWVLLLHIPLALAGPQHAFETAGVFEALALSGVALLVAGTRDRDGASR
jgi:uncharacterized membrane protein